MIKICVLYHVFRKYDCKKHLTEHFISDDVYFTVLCEKIKLNFQYSFV